MLNRGYWATTLLSIIGLAISAYVMMDTARRHRSQRDPGLDLVLPGGRRRPRDEHRLRLYHAVLHGWRLATGQGHRRGIQDRSRDQHHRRDRRRLRDDVRHGHRDRHRPHGELLPRRAGRSAERRRRERRRRVRDRRGHDGHAHDDGLHPRDGHVRTDHRQRRRHRRVQPRRGQRPRHHGQARRGRQHDQGPHEGLRDRLGEPRGVPAVQRVHRQGQPHPGSPDRGGHARDRGRAHDLGQPGQRERLRGRIHRRHDRVLLQLPGHPRCRKGRLRDHRRGAAPVPRDARDHGLQPAPRLRARRRHHDAGRSARDDPARRRGGRDTDHRRRAPRSTRRSPACSWSARSPACCSPPT